MIYEHEGVGPTIAPSAYVAPNAVVCGDVTIGEDARILFGAVLTAEGGPITVGARTIVMEQALLRGRAGHPVRVGDDVIIGPHAHVNGSQIAEECFLATGVATFPGARIGRGSEIRINGVVHVNTVVPPDTTVPIGWIAVGDPARLYSPAQHDELWEVQRAADFPGTVFGIPRHDMSMRKVTTGYSELFGRHRADRQRTARADTPRLPPLAAEDHVCADCALAYPQISIDQARRVIEGIPAEVRDVALAVPPPARHLRPGPDVWSVTEYVCHLRDVYLTYTVRLHRTRTEDRPMLEPMLNDLRARRFRYNERELAPILDELAATAAGFCAEIDRTRETEWDRVATRLPGEQRTARWLVRQAMHEGIHHLGDIRTVGRAIADKR
jgi:carbonic anhydrase/acetyltransferase-like protein (isoleucine patch superfamily)/uncharacterized damage-inducible protein DinB